MDLFPYTLIRLGGSTFEDWSNIKFDQINNKLQEVNRLKIQQREEKNRLCDALFDFISDQEDQDTQNKVQNLRRDIFNERKLKNNKVRKALEVLPEPLVNLLNGYIQLVKKIKEEEALGEEVYENELTKGREELKTLVDSEPLKKGLLLSSKTLLNRIDSFVKRPAEKFRKKEFQVEQSMLQYLTRMFAKTSPFSTFTNLSVGSFADNGHTFDITRSNGEEQVKGHIRLNNYLLKYLIDLLKNYRQAYLQLPLRCNPTIQKKEDHFFYLTNNNNIESFQRIPYNPVVELIINKVAEKSQGEVFSDLINDLKEEIDATAEDLENYVQQLVDFGLLEYNLGVSGIDPDWDRKLIKILQPLIDSETPHIKELTEQLSYIRKLGDEYASSSVKGRSSILQNAYDAFRAICMKIHEEAGLPEDERKTHEERLAEWREKQKEEKQKAEGEKKEEDKGSNDEEDKEKTFKHETSTFFSFKPEQIFYEDTTREVRAQLSKKETEELVEQFSELLNHLRQFKGQSVEKQKMANYFLEKYGAEVKVDVLTFYEDFFREVKKPEKEKEEARKKAAIEKEKQKQEGKVVDQEENKETEDSLPEFVKEYNELNKKWEKALSESLEVSPEVMKVDLSQIQKANEAIGFNATGEDQTSYGSFMQFFEENGKLKAVINGSFPGFGKMMSRFLHIFDTEVTDTIKDWNNKWADEDAIFIEDCDASYFNANLHPPLMPYEVWMPGSHNSLTPDKQIPITDFEICFNEKENSLQLNQKSTGKRAYVFDLGFQGHMGRSQLFQLLEKFSRAEYLFAHPVLNAVNSKLSASSEAKKEEKPEPKIAVLPRVEYQEAIVLQRKTWIVPKVLLPERGPQESDWQYFKKVNLWRINEQIPNEVFVVVNADRFGAANKKDAAKLTRDDYKPQYIDFTNPLLVNLLQKLIDKVPGRMKIMEMLPSSEQMLKIDNQRYVSECVVQWYNSNKN